jgi:hypothetical protein
MSDGNKREIRYIEETTWGTTPGTGNLTALPYVSGVFGPEIQTIRSRSVRSDAQVSGAVKTGEGARGSIEFEFAANQYDELLKGCMRADSNWSPAVSLAASDVAVSGATGNVGTYTTSGSVNFVTNIAVGQWVLVAGFASAGNNGWKKVTSRTSTTLVCAGGTFVNVAAGASVTFKTAIISNGSLLRHFSMQEQALDLTTKFKRILGARMTEFSLNIQPYQIITGGVSFQGKSFDASATASFTGTSNAAAAANEVMAEATTFTGFWRDVVPISTYDTYGFNLRLSSAARPAKKLGGVALSSLNQNAFEATGQITFYEVDNTWSYLTDLANANKFGIAVAFSNAGGSYIIEFPYILLSSESGRIPGLDQDVTLALDFAAEPGGTTTKTCIVCRAI